MNGIYRSLLRKWINKGSSFQSFFTTNILIIEYPKDSGIRYIARYCDHKYITDFDITETSYPSWVPSKIKINLNDIEREQIYKVGNSKYWSHRGTSGKDSDLIFEVCKGPLDKIRSKLEMSLIPITYINVLKTIFKNEPTSFVAEDIFGIMYKSGNLVGYKQKSDAIKKIDIMLRSLSTDGALKSLGLVDKPLYGKVHKYNINSHSIWNEHLDRKKTHSTNKIMVYLTLVLAFAAAFQGNIFHTEIMISFFCSESKWICTKPNSQK